jgi:hypothetical protein
MPNLSIRWRSRPDAAKLERSIDELRTTVIKLRREVETKTGYAATLELVLKQRAETIDQLNARLEQSRAQCRRLDQECENYFRMLQTG